jgi:V8-like Glu-specific endopeptidase
MMHHRRTSAALAAAIFSLGLSLSSSGIVMTVGPAGGGTTSAWDGVGTITNGFPDGGTGTLLDPYHVLTAAHIVAGLPAGHTVTFHVNGIDRTVSSIAYLGNYVGGQPTSTSDGTTTTRDYSIADRSDIAVLTLSSPITGVTTWQYNNGSLVESTAGPAHLVGYGYGGDGTSGENGAAYPFGTKREAINAVDRVFSTTTDVAGRTVSETSGNRNAVLPASVLAWDFDNTSTNGPLGGPALLPNTGPVEGDITTGDSGAPIFQFDPSLNSYVITGVAIDGTDDLSRFGEISWATRTADYSSFIASAVPEPTSIAGLLVGTALLLSRHRSKKTCGFTSTAE